MTTSRPTHELIQRYAAGPEALEAALSGLSPAEIAFKPTPEDWSIHEIVIHLADTDLVAAARIRHLLGEPGVTLVGMDQGHWGRVMRYAEQPLDAAVALFRALRTSTAAVLRLAPAQAWPTAGMHTRYGPQTLEWIVDHFADHLDGHLATIAKRRRQFAEARR
ncbi:MAG: DinB family protein [Armatimonadota bacterium]|nr:DinB family protein [Armatimonadota bacterium]